MDVAAADGDAHNHSDAPRSPAPPWLTDRLGAGGRPLGRNRAEPSPPEGNFNQTASLFFLQSAVFTRAQLLPLLLVHRVACDLEEAQLSLVKVTRRPAVYVTSWNWICDVFFSCFSFLSFLQLDVSHATRWRQSWRGGFTGPAVQSGNHLTLILNVLVGSCTASILAPPSPPSSITATVTVARSRRTRT